MITLNEALNLKAYTQNQDCDGDYFNVYSPEKYKDVVHTIFNSIGRCISCQFIDMPHPREPAYPCCTLLYDKNGFWKNIKDPSNSYCFEFKSKETK